MERFLSANFCTAISAKEKFCSIFLYAMMPPEGWFIDA
jgi:hypothetical protein